MIRDEQRISRKEDKGIPRKIEKKRKSNRGKDTARGGKELDFVHMVGVERVSLHQFYLAIDIEGQGMDEVEDRKTW